MSQTRGNGRRAWVGQVPAILPIALLAAAAAAGCSGSTPSTSPPGGGKLVVSLRTEPTTFDRLVASRAAEERITILTQSTLVRVNPVTADLEPRLATAWSTSPDHLTWTLTLRPGVAFSDGAPFTAADVVFTFQALYDPKVASTMSGPFLVDGKPLVVRAVDDHTVTVTFPSAYGPGIRVLDGLPILPAHKLAAALAAGTLRDQWGPSAAPSDVVGLGPFMLVSNTPGQSILFARNPHYWATDEAGHPLPHLDEVEVQILPQQDAEMVRLESGDLDVVNDFVRPEDIAALTNLQAKGAMAIVDGGVALDTSALWFDLAPESKAAKARPWLQKEELRQAISLAVDRKAIVDTVYLGAAVAIGGPVTPGFGDWYAADVPIPGHDVARAKQLLASAGLADRNGDGMLDDASGKPARFTLLTQKGRTDRERTSALIADELKAVGLAVDVVALDNKALIGRLTSDDYDAIYFGPDTGSPDPADNVEFWLSSGSFHLWNMHEDKGPATKWEGAIDDLMRRQSATVDSAERHRLFADVQRIFAAHQPAIYFAAPKAISAVSSRVHGVRASVIKPPVLWNVDRLSIGSPPAK